MGLPTWTWRRRASEIGRPRLIGGPEFRRSEMPHLSRDEPESTFAVSRLCRAGADDEWRLSTGPAPADIVRPAPNKGGVGASAWWVGHITLLIIGKPKVGEPIGQWRTPYDIGKSAQRARLDPVLLDAKSIGPPGGRSRQA